MEQLVLNAVQRNEKPHTARKSGYIPGVLYGGEYKEGLSVKFNKPELLKILTKHGVNAKIYTKINETQKLGIIKDIQKDPVSKEVIHIDVQMVDLTKDIRLHLPIVFKGRNKVEERRLLLQPSLTEIEVSGKADILPESIIVDVSEMQVGDSVFVRDLKLDESIKIHTDKDEQVAIITAWKESKAKLEETPAEGESAAAGAAAASESSGASKT